MYQNAIYLYTSLYIPDLTQKKKWVRWIEKQYDFVDCTSNKTMFETYNNTSIGLIGQKGLKLTSICLSDAFVRKNSNIHSPAKGYPLINNFLFVLIQNFSWSIINANPT